MSGMFIDGVFATSSKDLQGETLDIAGADISELEAGRGRFNVDHGKGFFNTIGIVKNAKKIFKAEDCENDRQRYYWNKIKGSFIYGSGELFDEEDHPHAKAAAAIMRHIHKNDTPLKMKASVEGGVVARGIKDPSMLTRTKIHSVALTFVPANNTTLIEPLSLKKSDCTADDEQLIKSMIPLVKNDAPNFIDISNRFTVQKIMQNVLKVKEMIKELNKNWTPEQKEKIVYAWGEDGDPAGKVGVPTATGKLRNNMMKELSNKTQSRINPETNEKEYRLYRTSHTKDNRHLKEITSWTTEPDFALEWSHLSVPNPKKKYYSESQKLYDENLLTNAAAKGYGKGMRIMAAWIPEKHIHSFLPPVQRELDSSKDGEGEVLVHPHDVKIDRSVQGAEYNNILNQWRQTMDDEGVPQKPTRRDFIKSLIAGYGGAGSPTNLSGGSVIQMESISKPVPGFKYVECRECGTEQPHMKHQVRCKKCGKPFDLDQLAKIFNLKD